MREKADQELFEVDELGGDVSQTGGLEVDETTKRTKGDERPKKRRRALRVDDILGTFAQEKSMIPSHVPKSKRAKTENIVLKNEKRGPETESYDIWTKVQVIPAPQDLPPPAILSYSKSLPALPPSTLRSSTHLLRQRESVNAVTVAKAGQSYNPALEDWEDLISRTAEEEQERLTKIAMKEWVPQPEDVETPAPEADSEDDDQVDQVGKGETYLAKPVKVQRKTRAQRNKQLRQQEQLRLRNLAQTLKHKHKQISNLPSLLSQITHHSAKQVSTQNSDTFGTGKSKKPKELPVAPLEVQLSDELAESLRLLKPEGNLFRDRYRSFVERGIVEGRFERNRRGRKFPVKYVEKYDYKHWGKYYGK